MIDFARVRRMMVDHQLRTYDITDLGILSAMNDIPREDFAPEEARALAYSDQSLPVARTQDGGRWLLPPMIFGRLLQNLRLVAGERALVVASGLGYEAVAMRRLGATVTVLESDEAVAARLRELLAAHGAGDVEVVVGPIENGCAGHGPFDVILLNGAAQKRPQALLECLAEDGRLGAIVGDGSRTSRATIFVRSGDTFGSRAIFDAAAPVLAPFREEPGFVF
ncbi:protein-L-isoaspartate O-methyltransferase family protein [Salinarimonas ramus]|uniref:Protein-L-isoaspartate O-methyltransferase n=1 Tax=Salinarimonas ramus TaxID=690164 RepID=A0A917QDM2_9HYPH|nr:protein-L-isoaspartate O-methyltransferase [Salinarimonas ramus]GGK43703.1 protein-L-isoaspartate O-methyltransferase [Salinarimonas ramus]